MLYGHAAIVLSLMYRHFTPYPLPEGSLKCLLNCIIKLHYILHYPAQLLGHSSLFLSTLQTPRRRAGCRVLGHVRFPVTGAVPDLRVTPWSILQLGHPRSHLAMIPQRWRATLLLAVHPDDVIADVPRGTALLTQHLMKVLHSL